MKIYVYRHASKCPYPFAEVDKCLPVHPGELQCRVRELLASGNPWATQSDIVISMIGWLVRRKEIALPLSIIYVDSEEIEIRVDTRGDLVEPWREIGFDSIQDAGFFYRFSI